MKALTVLVVVQSPVAHDSRVLRQIRSLLAGGFRVALLDVSLGPDNVFTIDNPLFHQLTDSETSSSRRWLALRISYFISAGILLLASIVNFLLDFGIFVSTLFVLAATTFLMGGIFRTRNLKERLAVNKRSRGFSAIKFLFLALRTGPSIREAIRLEAPNVVHLHDLFPLLSVRKFVSKAARPKTVWDAHELYHHQQEISWLRAKLTRLIVWRALPLINHVFTVSDGVAAQYKRDFRKFPPVSIIANASQATPVTTPFATLKESLRIGPRKKILLFQGGLSHGRGITFLLGMVRFLESRWVLVFLGSGPLEKEIVRSSSAHPGRVFLLQPVPPDQLAEWTSGASLGAIPYEDVNLNHRYSAPNKIWEYPVAGVPILARNLPALESFVVKNSMGIVFSDSDSEKSVAGMVNRLGGDDLARMAENARKFATRDNWQKYERQMFLVYAELLEYPGGFS